jgi:hypothetical protein
MTVAEAQEQLETLTRNLACSKISLNQRQICEAQMARYLRIIQRARQQAHRSLASPALALLNMTGHTDLDQDHNAALITAAYLIRCASIEQLAVAIPVAIREISTNNYWPIPVRFPEFREIAVCLLSLDNNTLTLERRIAIRTALQLSSIVSRKQIHQSVRRSRAHIDLTQSKQASRPRRATTPKGVQ